jgi:hypothetical protein
MSDVHAQSAVDEKRSGVTVDTSSSGSLTSALRGVELHEQNSGSMMIGQKAGENIHQREKRVENTRLA